MEELSRKEQHLVIFGITIGSILEWYDAYLYIFWAPIFAKLFFNTHSDIAGLTGSFLLFWIGFLARPLGGVFFGRLGDLIGRKKSFILSIMMTAIPTLLIGLLPTFSQVGVLAPILLGILRFAQSFPAGGEQPGAFCYLYESANQNNKRYLTSWGAVGNQIGIILSMLECYLLEEWMSPEQLMSWGWRISFGVGGIIGLLGLYLRSKLHETPVFIDLRARKQLVQKSILQVFNKYKWGIFLGISFCMLDAVGFYLISSLFPAYFDEVLSKDYSGNILIAIVTVLATTIPLPFFGVLGDKMNNKFIMLFCSLGILLLLYPIYKSISCNSVLLVFVFYSVAVMLFTCITALIPYLLCDLFPAKVRFTCVGLSYNVVDGMIGGLVPVLALYLFSKSGNVFSFFWLIGISGIISFVSYFFIKNSTEPTSHAGKN